MATFAKIKMVSENVTAYDITGKFVSNEQLAEVEDGALVVVGDLRKSTVYDNKDMNVFEIKAPANDTDEVAIVDLSDVGKGDVRGDKWRVGMRLDGLVADAGQPVRVRILKPYDRFWFSDAGFVSTPEVGKFAIPTANDTKFTPSETKVEGKLNVKIEMVKDFVLGQTVAGKMYYCRVL